MEDAYLSLNHKNAVYFARRGDAITTHGVDYSGRITVVAEAGDYQIWKKASGKCYAGRGGQPGAAAGLAAGRDHEASEPDRAGAADCGRCPMTTAATACCSLCRGTGICDDPFADTVIPCPRCADPLPEPPEPVQPACCSKCGQRRREMVNTGDRTSPYWKCHTCLHREARRQNCREMWGRGRRGY